MIKILIADDHLIIRQGLRLILETENDFEFIGEASDGAEALTLCKKLKPDVVLMDLRMPNMDGLTAIEKLRVEQPSIAVVILTTFNEDELMFRGLQAGARGYLLKDTDRNTLFDTIRAAARGETLLKPDIMARLLARTNKTSTTETKTTGLVNPTEREQEVLDCLAQGFLYKEIAEKLGVSYETVHTYVRRIYEKLQVRTRTEAVAKFLRR